MAKKILRPFEKKRVGAHLIEFFVFGLAMGVIEDLLAIHFATDVRITFRVFKVAFIVAFPFALIGVFLADFSLLKRFFNKK